MVYLFKVDISQLININNKSFRVWLDIEHFFRQIEFHSFFCYSMPYNSKSILKFEVRKCLTFSFISLCYPIKMYSHVLSSFKLCINLLLITSNWWLIFYLFSHTFLQSFSSHSFLLKFDTFWSIKVNYLYIKISNQS